MSFILAFVTNNCYICENEFLITMENLGLGFQLMGIGMVTVFIILLVVIYGSSLLIKLINRIAPEEVAKKKPAAADTAAPMAVLEAAVAQLTGGKGHIVKVTKVN